MSERGPLYLQTPLALLDRVRKNGGKEIRNVMSDWKFWIPTKKGQVTRLCVVVNTHLYKNSCTCLPAALQQSSLSMCPQQLVLMLQSTQQGGAFIFQGETCVWQYFDPATAAHVNAQRLLKRALEIAGKN